MIFAAYAFCCLKNLDLNQEHTNNKLQSSVFFPLAFFNLPNNLYEIFYSSYLLVSDKIITTIELYIEYKFLFFIFILFLLILLALIDFMEEDRYKRLADLANAFRTDRTQRDRDNKEALLRKITYQMSLNRTGNTRYLLYDNH
jgi:hypothetical protein